MATKTKRGYSRDFTPHGDSGKNYLLDSVPAGLWSAVRLQAKRDGLSVRALILGLLAAYLAGEARPKAAQAGSEAAR